MNINKRLELLERSADLEEQREREERREDDWRDDFHSVAMEGLSPEARAQGFTWREFISAADELMLTMGAEHAAIVNREYETHWEHKRHANPLRASRLTEVFDDFARSMMYLAKDPVMYRAHKRTYALPPVVCEVLLSDPHVRMMHDCEDCGLKLPYRPVSSRAEERIYFERCPLCGGRVGQHFYYLKEHGEGF